MVSLEAERSLSHQPQDKRSSTASDRGDVLATVSPSSVVPIPNSALKTAEPKHGDRQKSKETSPRGDNFTGNVG